MRKYPVQEKPIGSGVSEILRYTQTDRQTNRHPVTLLQGFNFNALAIKKIIRGLPDKCLDFNNFKFNKKNCELLSF